MKKLKKAEVEKLNQQAQDIRKQILQATSVNGGHLSANLGVVELTMMLHNTFAFPIDTLIFDVGHQCYAHKILSGRPIDPLNFRHQTGISGFTDPNESRYDTFSTGHSGTAISLAIGRALASPDKGFEKSIIAFVGDASSTNGLSLEGLNFLGAHPEIKVIVIINDNDMSVSPNVGALAKTFNKIRVKRNKAFIYKITPKFMHGFLNHLKRGLKNLVYRPSLFDAFNLKYFSGIDGHDFNELNKYLNFAKNYPGSIVLHINTIKGKGYLPAENDNIGDWHHVGPFDLDSGKIASPSANVCGEALANYLVENNDQLPNYHIFSAAMLLGNGLTKVLNTYPEKVTDVGIAEENAVEIASGMASEDVVPIVFIYAVFLQRAYDELLNDVARTSKHIVFCLDHAGLVPFDGPTHQGIYDLSFLIPLPNFVIYAPASIKQLNQALVLGMKQKGPVAIRYPQTLPDESDDFTVNWQIIKPLADINVLSYGEDVYQLKECLKNYNIGLVNVTVIKPLDDDALLKLAKSKKLIIYEQASNSGSLADQVLSFYQSHGILVPIKKMAIDPNLLRHGTKQEMKEMCHISYQEIINELK